MFKVHPIRLPEFSSTSTPVSRKGTVEQPKRKNQFKLRTNQRKTGNVLIIRSSITKDIKIKTLKDNVTININRGGTNYVSQEKC